MIPETDITALNNFVDTLDNNNLMSSIDCNRCYNIIESINDMREDISNKNNCYFAIKSAVSTADYANNILLQDLVQEKDPLDDDKFVSIANDSLAYLTNSNYILADCDLCDSSDNNQELQLISQQ